MLLTQENASPEEHGEYIWDNYVKRAAAKHIAIIAHSYGGIVTTHLVSNYFEFKIKYSSQ